MKIKAILFDFIGTVVTEKDSRVLAAGLSNAFAERGIFLKPDFFDSVRGQDNLGIINDVLTRYNLPPAMAGEIYESFAGKVKKNFSSFSAFDDAPVVLSLLLRIGILTGISTGLPRELSDGIFSHLGWSTRGIDYMGFSGAIWKGRPVPNIIFDMMTKLGIKEPKEVLKVTNTIAGIREGKSAGCVTGLILPGFYQAGELKKENPDYILGSLSDVKKIVLESAMTGQTGVNKYDWYNHAFAEAKLN